MKYINTLIKISILLNFIFIAIGIDNAIAFSSEIQSVHEIKANKNDIYNSTLLWFAESFNSSKSVIQLKDKDLGVFVGNGITTVSSIMSYPLKFKIKIDIKDNKVRITYTEVAVYNKPMTMDISWQISDTKIENSLKSISQSYIDYISQNKQNKEW